MKTFLSILTFLGLSACSSTENPITNNEAPSRAYHAAHNVPSHGVALEGYCPVAYFAVNKPVRGKPEFASTHNGVTYHLVSADAKAAFDQDPEKYLPAYGGWCAFGMSVQDKFPVDPTNFQIVDGQLMLFLKNESIDARDLWNQGDTRELQTKAAAHWRKVQG
ncbi:MAG: YHS domain-containing (seleno)protein [Planctomycetota bacterium]